MQNIPNKAGIYVFKANFQEVYQDWSCRRKNKLEQRENFIKTLKDNWSQSSEANSSRINSEICRRKINLRDNTNEFSKDWVTFYVGKHKNLNERLNEHLFGCRHNSTYCLRLMDRNNYFAEVPFRLYYYELPDFADNELYFMIQEFERLVRNSFKPIVGKQ